ncbi:hypothetical protein ACH4ZU_12185 [Streptomyces sp. NPDC020472]|uniref:hypothetical protein n=1 Tax=Streptomyces sp. NPDC020472 TaxID=3365075 RepID=UPI0037A74565
MTDALRAPSITDAEIDELLALHGRRITDSFLVRLAFHYFKAENEGVINPARYFADYLGVQRQTVLTYMRMVRLRSLLTKNRP